MSFFFSKKYFKLKNNYETFFLKESSINNTKLSRKKVLKFNERGNKRIKRKMKINKEKISENKNFNLNRIDKI